MRGLARAEARVRTNGPAQTTPRILCYIRYIPLPRNRSFSYSTRARLCFEIVGRACVVSPFLLCRYFRKTIPHLYFVKFRETLHVDAFECYCINHDNVADRVVKYVLQRWGTISISSRSRFYWLWRVRTCTERIYCVHWSYMSYQVDPHRPPIFFVKIVQFRGFISNRWKSTSTNGKWLKFQCLRSAVFLVAESNFRFENSAWRFHNAVSLIPFGLFTSAGSYRFKARCRGIAWLSREISFFFLFRL